MANPGIVVVKSFTYRDLPEEWSNGYHFAGSAPESDDDWISLCDDFIALEAAALANTVHIVRVLCYDDYDGTHDSVYTYDLATHSGTVPGTRSEPVDATGSMAGDQAYFARWPTGQRSSKGKPIYLFKYWHGAWPATDDRDKLSEIFLGYVSTFASAVIAVSGSWPGMTDKSGNVPTGYYAEPFLTTRTLKRRGRRPT